MKTYRLLIDRVIDDPEMARPEAMKMARGIVQELESSLTEAILDRILEDARDSSEKAPGSRFIKEVEVTLPCFEKGVIGAMEVNIRDVGAVSTGPGFARMVEAANKEIDRSKGEFTTWKDCGDGTVEFTYHDKVLGCDRPLVKVPINAPEVGFIDRVYAMIKAARFFTGREIEC